jgi:hypothetical protein
MATKQVRWKCAKCDSGVLAPSKPRKDDIRRYCLPCSEEAGRLQMRVAPALEKQRERSAMSNKKKNQRKRQTASKRATVKNQKAATLKARQRMFDKEAARIWDLMEPWHKNKYNGKVPKVVLGLAKTVGHGGGGHATTWNHTVQVNLSQLQTATSQKYAWHVLAHELAHCACPPVLTNGKRDVHHREFYLCLKAAVEKRWKTQVSFYEVTGQYGYSVDRIIERQVYTKVVFPVPSIRAPRTAFEKAIAATAQEGK